MTGFLPHFFFLFSILLTDEKKRLLYKLLLKKLSAFEKYSIYWGQFSNLNAGERISVYAVPRARIGTWEEREAFRVSASSQWWVWKGYRDESPRMAFSLITDGEDNCVDWFHSFPKQRGDRFDVMNLSGLLYLWRYKTLHEQTLTND